MHSQQLANISQTGIMLLSFSEVAFHTQVAMKETLDIHFDRILNDA
jgi:hypothetical protein